MIRKLLNSFKPKLAHPYHTLCLGGRCRFCEHKDIDPWASEPCTICTHGSKFTQTPSDE